MDKIGFFEKKFSQFAGTHISEKQKLHERLDFPQELWEQMSKDRLFGVGIKTEYGGHGGDFSSIAAAGKALAEHGGNLGVAMTWMMHEIISRWLIQQFGSPEQKNRYLPELARGSMTASFAISEPDTGAHPKFMKTAAESVNDRFRINGEKAYLTNGPMADLFIVIAVTGKQSGKNQFTAFLVPRQTTGLSVTDPLDLPILKPAPHGGILLDNCTVEQKNIFGPFGSAYDMFVKPFREIEDTLLMGPISGGMKYELHRLRLFLKKQRAELDDEKTLELGRLQCMADALSALSLTAADMIEQPLHPKMLTSVTLYFRDQAAEFQDRLQKILALLPGETDIMLTAMANDIAGSIRIASNVAKMKLKKMGETFMTPGRST